MTIPEMPPVPCVECNANVMVLRAGKVRPYYSCRGFPRCRGRMSANADGTPRGKPRTLALQAARKAFHDEVRRLQPLKRGNIYEWLAVQLGIPQDECHAGRMGMERAERAVAVLRAATPDTIQWWFDAGKPPGV